MSPYAEQELHQTKWWPADKQDYIVALVMCFFFGIFVGLTVASKGPTPQQIKQSQEARK
jgi:hypothetical protein